VPVPDMQGKTVVVTGANSGIGLEAAEALAGMGARVIVTARNADKGRAAVAGIVQRLGGHGQVQLVVFDLADLSSVRRGADEILDQTPRLDVLLNNAGVVLSERHVTVDGFEATFATNHLGPFLLTNLLLDRLRESAPARIVNVASTAHNTARKGIPFDDLQSTRRYRGMRVYGWRVGWPGPESRPTRCIRGQCGPVTARTATLAASLLSASRSPSRSSSHRPRAPAHRSIWRRRPR